MASNYDINLAAGTYHARAISAGMYETKNGALMVGVQWLLDNEAHNTITSRDCIISKAGVVMEKKIAQIREWAPGWDGTIDGSDWFADHFPEFDVNVVVERRVDAYDNQEKPEIAFINPIDRVAPGTIPAGDANALAAKFGAKLRALAGAAPKPVAVPGKAKAPAAKANAAADKKNQAWNAFKTAFKGAEAERTPAWLNLVARAVPDKHDYNAFTAADWDAVVAAVGEMNADTPPDAGNADECPF